MMFGDQWGGGCRGAGRGIEEDPLGVIFWMVT